MKTWKAEVELAIEDMLIATRTHIAQEVIEAIHEWRSGTRSEVTIIASSHQNGPAEPNIRTAKANMRAMLKEVGLLLEFWNEAVEHDAYIRICSNIGPDSNGINRSLTEVFTGTLPDIKMCKIWESKCYSYINRKTNPNGQHHDTL
jgi:hypothetical protein